MMELLTTLMASCSSTNSTPRVFACLCGPTVHRISTAFCENETSPDTLPRHVFGMYSVLNDIIAETAQIEQLRYRTLPGWTAVHSDIRSSRAVMPENRARLWALYIEKMDTRPTICRRNQFCKTQSESITSTLGHLERRPRSYKV